MTQEYDLHKALRRFSSSSQKMKNLWAYAFLWSGAVSLFFGFLFAVNALKIGFFLQYPRTIHVNMFSPSVDLHIWFGSIFIFMALSFILRYFGLRIRIAYFGIAVSTILLGFLLLSLDVNHLSFMTGGRTIGTLLVFLGGLMHLTFHVASWNRAFSVSGKTAIMITIVYISSLVIPIEFSASTFWILSAFNPANTIGKEKALLELQLSYLPYSILPLLYLAFLFSWVWAPVLFFLISRFGKKRFYERFSQLRSVVPLISSGQKDSPSGEMTVKPRRIGSKIILFSSLLIGVFMAYYPYFHGPSWLVGTDTYWRYLDPLQKIVESENSWTTALQERHPAYLLILLGLKTITSASSFLVVKFMPMASVLLLALATFWLVKVGTKNEYLASLTSVFSVLSITTTEGVYTGILANWFTLILWTLFFVFFLKVSENRVLQEKSSKAQLRYFLILSVLSLGILFVHPWTWGVFLGVFICHVGLTVLRDRSVGWKTGVMAVLILLINGGAVILSVLLLPNIQGWRLVNTFLLYGENFQHLGSLLWFWDVLNFLVRVWSVFLSPVTLILAVVGMVFMMSRRRGIENLIISWTAVASIGSILAAPLGYGPSWGSSLATHTELIRMLFITPFQIPAAIGLYYIVNMVQHSLSRSSDEKSMKHVAASSSWSALTLLMFHYAIITGLLLTGHSVLGLISLLILNFAVVTVLVSSSRDRLQVYVASLITLLVLFSLVNGCFRGLFSLLTDPNYYRPS